MRRVISLFLSLCMIPALVSCASTQGDKDSNTKETSLSTELNITYTSDIPNEYAQLSFPESAEGGAKLAYRIFPWFWYDDEAWARTVAGLRKYANVIDEVTLFCDQFNIPVATNIAMAEVIITALDRGDLDWRELVNPRSAYNRK